VHLRIRFRVVRVRVPMSGVATRVKKCDCCLEKFRALDNSAKTPMCRTTGVRCAPVDLLQGEVAAAGDVIHDAGSALNGALDKRRTGGCLCISQQKCVLAKCPSKEKCESVACRQQSIALGSQQPVAACELISYTSVNHGDLPDAVAAGRRAWRGEQQNQTRVCREQDPTRAASSARLRPEETPTPSIAVPLLHMMALTSAKSTFTRPGMVMMSLMP